MKFCDYFLPKIDEYEQLLTKNRIWINRTRNIGVISGEDAIALGVTGPVLRGSGVKWDIRKAQPYEAYDKVEFDIPIGEHGDTYDRYIVRMAEMRQSVRIIRQCVERLGARADFRKSGESHQAAGGRGLPFHRGAQRRTRLLRGQRRDDQSLPRARAAAVAHQLAGIG